MRLIADNALPGVFVILCKRALVALNDLEMKRIEKAAERYLQKRRPPPHIRPELDIGYRISGQSIELFEIRPMWRNPGVKQEYGIAKATYVRTRDVWKLFWLRQDLKWHGYEPQPTAATIEEFFAVVDKDEFHCFFG
jgi:hypothetical protein